MVVVVIASLVAVVAIGVLAFWMIRRLIASVVVLRWLSRWRTLGLTVIVAQLLFVAIAVLFGRSSEPPSPPPSLPPRVPTGNKVVLLGIDGATAKILDRLLEAGELPHFRSVIERGVYSELGTLMPTNSPVLWTSVVTGVERYGHGVMNFLVQHPRGMSRPVGSFPSHMGLNTTLVLNKLYGRQNVATYPVTAVSRRAATLWEIADANGLTVGVVNWWPSWPADDVRGFMVSNAMVSRLRLKMPKRGPIAAEGGATGMAVVDVGDTGMTTPPELAAELDARVATWQQLSDAELLELALELYSSHGPDLFLVYLAGPDGAQHYHWDAYEPRYYRSVDAEYIERHRHSIPNVYRFMDHLLGSLLESIGEESTIVIVSDHGGGPTFDPLSSWVAGHEHAPPGILIAAGPGIRPGARPDRPSILDIAPTVLRLLGIASSETMTGRALTEILSPELAARVTASTPTWDFLVEEKTLRPDPEISEEEEKRLRALGYID
jgi:predicted AlkP superfamily phosphohydrolase/phosphomutase